MDGQAILVAVARADIWLGAMVDARPWAALCVVCVAVGATVGRRVWRSE